MALPTTYRNHSECGILFSTHHYLLFILGGKHFADLFLYRPGPFWEHPKDQ